MVEDPRIPEPAEPIPVPQEPFRGWLRNGWYVACPSRELDKRPRPFLLGGAPLVLFRSGDGRPGALLDRCAHRNVPLSLGRVVEDRLQCAYHGWEYDVAGKCCHVPGLTPERLSQARNVASHPVREQDGFVWIWANVETEPNVGPFRFPFLDERGYTSVRRAVDMDASLLDVAENALDVPHTAYLHGGLFRSAASKRREIEVVTRRWRDRVEAEYVGEARPSGIAGRILAPRGGTVTHFDRFLLPSIVQVEYRLGDATHFCVTAALTPLTEHRTRLFTVVSFRLPFPGWLVTPFLTPVAMRIFQQDAEMLRHQTDNVRRFGGQDYRSTEVDVLGPLILRILRRAEATSASDSESQAGAGAESNEQDPAVRKFHMLV